MNTTKVSNYQPRTTSAELSASITERINELAAATDAARMSDEIVKYLDTLAKFHQYSPSNIWMILINKPDATLVAGFRKWQTMNRYVKKGEKGIPILAPILVKEDKQDPDSDQLLCGFKAVYVFDVSQTEGDPLPEPPNWKSPEKNKELEEKLIQFANSRGIQVSVVKQDGEIQGVSKGGNIEVDPGAGTKTLIHEIAHELMHRDTDRPIESSVRELEAEAVAYVVGKYFGLEDLSSPNYVVLHGATMDLITEHLERIRKASLAIISEIPNNGQLIV